VLFVDSLSCQESESTNNTTGNYVDLRVESVNDVRVAGQWKGHLLTLSWLLNGGISLPSSDITLRIHYTIYSCHIDLGQQYTAAPARKFAFNITELQAILIRRVARNHELYMQSSTRANMREISNYMCIGNNEQSRWQICCTHRVRTHAIFLHPNPNPNPNLDLWPFNPKTMSLLGYPKVILRSFVFLSYRPTQNIIV